MRGRRRKKGGERERERRKKLVLSRRPDIVARRVTKPRHVPPLSSAVCDKGVRREERKK